MSTTHHYSQIPSVMKITEGICFQENIITGKINYNSYFLERILSSYYSDQDQNDCYDKKDVNKATKSKRSDYSKEPKND